MVNTVLVSIMLLSALVVVISAFFMFIVEVRGKQYKIFYRLYLINVIIMIIVLIIAGVRAFTEDNTIQNNTQLINAYKLCRRHYKTGMVITFGKNNQFDKFNCY